MPLAYLFVGAALLLLHTTSLVRTKPMLVFVYSLALCNSTRVRCTFGHFQFKYIFYQTIMQISTKYIGLALLRYYYRQMPLLEHRLHVTLVLWEGYLQINSIENFTRSDCIYFAVMRRYMPVSNRRCRGKPTYIFKGAYVRLTYFIFIL